MRPPALATFGAFPVVFSIEYYLTGLLLQTQKNCFKNSKIIHRRCCRQTVPRASPVNLVMLSLCKDQCSVIVVMI
jgi:hypothetical protein